MRRNGVGDGLKVAGANAHLDRLAVKNAHADVVSLVAELDGEGADDVDGDVDGDVDVDDAADVDVDG